MQLHPAILEQLAAQHAADLQRASRRSRRAAPLGGGLFRRRVERGMRIAQPPSAMRASTR